MINGFWVEKFFIVEETGEDKNLSKDLSYIDEDIVPKTPITKVQTLTKTKKLFAINFLWKEHIGIATNLV